jgi:tetratricopeptide (TPR) repeat protein
MSKVLLTLALSFVIFYSSIVIVQAQLQGQARIDSLLKELPKAKQDTNHVNLLADLSFEHYSIDPDKGVELGEKGLKLSEKIGWKEGQAKCCNSLGANNIGKSNYPKALEYFGKALKINKEIADKRGIASNLGNMGNVYNSQSDYSKALEYFGKALKINEEIADKRGIASNLGNMGNVYNSQSDYSKALEYFHKALKINEELGNKRGIAINLGNMGIIYENQSDYPKALEFYGKALKINEEIGNKRGIASNLGNMGIIYKNQSDYPKALEFYGKALKINEELGSKNGIAFSLGNMGALYLKLSQDSVIINPSELNEFVSLNKEINLNNSIEYSLQAIEIFEEIGELNGRSYFFKTLADAYKQKGDYKKAYEAFKEYKSLKDSVFSMDKQKEFANLDAKRENELKDAEIIILNTEKKAQQFQSYLLSGGVIVLLGAFGVALLRFREKKKLSEELAKQKQEIETQKSLVEEKNEEIYASIRYASTIQNAILPWDATLAKGFSEFMVFYKPKDIVSGDSYWFKEVDGVKFLAVIDCTGHGIPGSMLTVIASSVLDDAVLGKRLKDTGEILTYMNEKVTEVLNQRLKENEVRDSMEVALIAIHQEKIQFSGAGRPLYLKNGTFEILKTDRRGIAGRAEDDKYIYSVIEFEKSNDIRLYLSTDGFADQMNESGKKYSSRRFLALLESIAENPLSEQYKILNNELAAHQGDKHQIDDITIVGVRV